MTTSILALLNVLKSEMDPEAIAMVDGLLSQQDEDNRVLVIYDSGKVQPDIQERLETLQHLQFHTRSENELYCRGTTSLLPILEAYQCVHTESVTFIAAPDSKVGGAIHAAQKAFIIDPHIEEYYDHERTVNVYVLLPHGVIVFTFVEEVEL